MTENNKTLGWYIRQARREAKLTQNELAKKIGTEQPSIARAENNGCSLEFAEKAVDVCGFRISNIALRAKDPFRQGMTFLC